MLMGRPQFNPSNTEKERQFPGHRLGDRRQLSANPACSSGQYYYAIYAGVRQLARELLAQCGPDSPSGFVEWSGLQLHHIECIDLL